MKLAHVLTVLSIFLSGCAMEKPISPASQEEMSAARKSLVACAWIALPKIDDGITSAEIIAEVLMKVCKAEADILFETVMINQSDPVTRHEVKETVSKGRNLIPLVLKYRADK